MLLWFLPGIFLLGIITSYTDIKEGKIKNKHVILALLYSIVIYSVLIYLNWGSIKIEYFIELIAVCVLSLIVGFFMWYIGLWTAGDAKLFFAYSALIPLSVYKFGHIRYFDSLNVLFNTFIPVFLFILFILLVRTSWKKKLFFIKEALQPKIILSVALSLFSFSWLIDLFFKTLNLSLTYLILIPLLFLVVLLFEKVGLMRMIYIFVAFSVLRLVFDPGVYSFIFVRDFLLILALFIFLRFFVMRMGFYLLTKEVDIKLLGEGMVPAEIVYLEEGKYKKKEAVFFNLFDYVHLRPRKNYLFTPSEPLSKDDIVKLKKLESKLEFEHLRVQQTLPFAPFLFFGVLLTLIVQGNIFIVLRNLI